MDTLIWHTHTHTLLRSVCKSSQASANFGIINVYHKCLNSKATLRLNRWQFKKYNN